MAEIFKRSSATVTATIEGSAQTVYTVPALTTAVIIGMRIANIDGTGSYNISVFVDQGANNYYISGKSTPVPSGSALELQEGKLVCETGDIIKVYSDTTSKLDITISYIEVT